MRHGRRSRDFIRGTDWLALSIRKGFNSSRPLCLVSALTALVISVVLVPFHGALDTSANLTGKGSLGVMANLLTLAPYLTVLVYLVFVLFCLFFVRKLPDRAFKGRLAEFALLRIRGYSMDDIRRLLLADMVLGSVTGTLLGILAGWGIGHALASRMTSGPGEHGGGPPFWQEGMIILSLTAVLILTPLLLSLVTVRRHVYADPFKLIMEGQ